MNEEQLIELVKLYPTLYDRTSSQYKDNATRNNAWEEIAGQLNTTAEDCKDKWAKLRNCFTNAIKRRKKKNPESAANLTPWKHERQMAFLVAHIQRRSNRATDEENLYTYEAKNFTDSSSDENYVIHDVVDAIKPKNILEKRSLPKLDENDMFFLSMSMRLKKMAKSDQARIKLDLHKMIHDVEMTTLYKYEENDEQT